MSIFRRISLGLAAFLFSSCLSLLAAAISIAMVLGTSDTVKSALRQSGLYGVFLQDFATPGTATTGVSGSGLAGVMTPILMQQTTESFIDATYDWARGDSKAPSSEEVQASFENAVAAEIQRKIEALPPCGSMTPPLTIDVSTLTCLPAGVSSATLTESIQAQLSVGAGQMGAAQSEVPLAEQLAFLPVFYRAVQVALVIVPVLLIVTMLGVILLSPTKRSGARRVAWILITVGALQTAAGLVGAWILHQVAVQSVTDPPTLQGGVLLFCDMIVPQLNVWWTGTSIVYVIVGFTMFLIVFLSNRQRGRMSFRNHKHIDSNTIK